MKCVLLILMAAFTLSCSDTLPTEPMVATDGSGQVASVDELSVLAKKPASVEMKAWFNPGYFVDPTGPNYYGTFTTGGVAYGLVFHHVGSGKPFGDDNLRGNAFFGYDRADVYTWINFDPATQELEVGEHLLTIYDQLVFRWKQSTWSSRGLVVEASGLFADWAGLKMSGHGQIVWTDSGLPWYSEGTIIVR